MSELEFKKLESNEAHKFILSWEEAFERKLGDDVYEWLFKEKNIIYVAKDKDRDSVAAGYCLYPLESKINGENGFALLCNNVFVHPEYQGKQLFVRLGKFALKDAGSNGFGKIAYGIPNPLALPGHKRVGWDIKPAIKFLEKKVCSNHVAGQPSWVDDELTEKQKKDIERCSRKSSQGRAFSIIKNASFVRWRFEDKPGVKYKFGLKYKNGHLVAYCVCKFFEPSETLHIVDIDGVDDRAIDELIRESESIDKPFKRINVWGSTFHAQRFVSNGYVYGADSSSLIFIEPKELKAFAFDGNLNISLADNDVY